MPKQITKKELEEQRREHNAYNEGYRQGYLEGYNRRLHEEREPDQLSHEERALELEKVSLCETAEYRDRQRTALFYLSLVGHVTPDIKKAVTWSLGSILSGCDLPDFGQPKDNTFPTNF